MIYNSSKEDSRWFAKIDGQRKPIIFVCMGSTGKWDKLSFLNDSYFAKYTIVTAGDSKKVLSGPHIISKEFVNIGEVLKRTNMMICHGGNGTIYQGILNDVYNCFVSQVIMSKNGIFKFWKSTDTESPLMITILQPGKRK